MKCILIFVVAVFCCTMCNFVSGMSTLGLEIVHHTVNSTKKYIGYDGTEEEVDCVSWYGCSRGYCWTGCCWHDCEDYHNNKVQHGEWCWSAPPGSKPQSYQTCITNSDCSNCWICTGSCDAFRF